MKNAISSPATDSNLEDGSRVKPLLVRSAFLAVIGLRSMAVGAAAALLLSYAYDLSGISVAWMAVATAAAATAFAAGSSQFDAGRERSLPGLFLSGFFLSLFGFASVPVMYRLMAGHAVTIFLFVLPVVFFVVAGVEKQAWKNLESDIAPLTSIAMLAGVPLAFGLQFSLGYFLSAALISFSISVAGASLFFFKKDRLGQSKIGWILLTAIAFLISFTACIFAEPLRHTMELHYFSIRP